jgi:hypothetical protein
MAALETVNSYRARTHVDLIAVAQIIASGLAAVSSASLSMADDISLAMTLRLRVNANACDRSADRNRRALEKNQFNPVPQPVFGPAPDPDADRKDAEVIARVAATRQRAEALQARPAAARPGDPAPVAAPDPAATPDPAAAATPVHAATQASAATQVPAAVPEPAAAPELNLTERQIQDLWGAAMSVVANEYAANLPKAERDVAERNLSRRSCPQPSKLQSRFLVDCQD